MANAVKDTGSGGLYNHVPPLTFSASHYAHYRPTGEDYVETFRKLVRKWRYDTLTVSSSDDILCRDELRAIVSLGEKVIPLIIDEIKSRPDHLMAALFLITNEDPVPESAKGDLSEMANYWIDWYEQIR